MDEEFNKFFEPVGGSVDMQIADVDNGVIEDMIRDAQTTKTNYFQTLEFRYRPYIPENMYVMLDEGAKMPVRSTGGSAGYDLSAKEDSRIKPGHTGAVDTGVYIAIPRGWVGLVLERSSLHKIGLGLANKVGVIDSDYRGPIVLMLHNYSPDDALISHGQRLAQLVIVPFADPDLIEVGNLDETERGDGGFGSTGRN